jgi:hypothetical protein
VIAPAGSWRQLRAAGAVPRFLCLHRVAARPSFALFRAVRYGGMWDVEEAVRNKMWKR